MKTVTCTYTTAKTLISFLKEEGIEDNSALLIQVFSGVSEKNSIKQLQVSLASIFSKATLVGVTSDGNIIKGDIPKLGQTTISFSQFEHTTLTSALVCNYGNDLKTGQLLGEKIKQQDTQAVIAFSDGLNTNGESFIAGLSGEMSSSIVIAGGMAGDGGKLQQTFVFNLTEITTHGGIAVALNGSHLQVHTHYNFGWQPVGNKMRVTRAKNNVVYEIDGQPIQRIYKKYFSSNVVSISSKLGLDSSLFEFPLIKFEEGTYIARAAISRLDNGGISFAGNVNEGDIVRFGIGDKEKIIDGASNMLAQLQEESVESVFIYSCTARRRLLGPESTHELTLFRELTNVSGFYTYGEFFYHQEHQKINLLNHTMTVLALSESVESRINLNFSSVTPNFKESPENGYIKSLIAVSNFAVSISKDFEALNEKLEAEVKKKSQELLCKTLINELTQLPNRQALLQDLKSLNKNENKTLIIININNFSKINAFYGLEAGDELLAKVADSLKNHLKAQDYSLIEPKLYKLPSDSYAILTHIMDKAKLASCMNRLNKRVFSHSYQILDFDIFVQATWVFNMCDGSDKSLIQAELAGKEARLNNQNFIYYRKEDFAESQHRIQLAHQIRTAILKNKIYPVFQPIYDNQTGELVKYECLARLKDSEGTVISPLVFIQVAQVIQMYPIVTEIMVHKSFRAFQGTGLSFSINLALEDILSSHTQQMIFEAMAYYGVSQQVTFEILEDQALKEEEAIFAFIIKVKEMGAKIAIDDFGSGYANYQHLAKLQADYIKIDGSLIKNLELDFVAVSVVESMIVFAKKLNMKVIAEFVCNRMVYEKVQDVGIDYSQGFYLSEPLDRLPVKVKNT